jgi:DNA-directed RNA polymerase subunit alpha
MELTVERGVGYLPSDGRESVPLGVVPVDAVFTPIRRVNYTVESARVGARTDLDRLVIDVQTDGTITPVAALVQSANILIDQFALFQELQQERRGKADKQGLSAGPVPSRIFDMPIEQLELSQRTYNCLKRSQITKVGQILQMSENELLSLRNFGQKSLVELREKLQEHGVLPEGAATEGSGATLGSAVAEESPNGAAEAPVPE